MTLTDDELRAITDAVQAKLGNQGAGVSDSFMALLNRQGNDSLQASMQLFTENFELRGKNRTLQGELTTAQAASETPEGKTLIDKADAELIEAYKALGTPDEITKTKTDFATTERTTVLDKVAKIAGYEPSVFNRLATELTFEEREETIEGEKKPYVVVLPGEGKEAVRLEAYADENWKEFLPALSPTGDGAQAASTTPVGGTAFVKQKASGDVPKKGSVLDQHIAAREKRSEDKGPLDS